MATIAATLCAMARSAQSLESVKREDLRCGDSVVVSTRNSSYVITALEDDLYSVRGGWFDRQGPSPHWLAINGCTWGGSAIKQDVVAACGLRLEFGNRVVTSPIRHIALIPQQAACNPN